MNFLDMRAQFFPSCFQRAELLLNRPNNASVCSAHEQGIYLCGKRETPCGTASVGGLQHTKEDVCGSTTFKNFHLNTARFSCRRQYTNPATAHNPRSIGARYSSMLGAPRLGVRCAASRARQKIFAQNSSLFCAAFGRAQNLCTTTATPFLVVLGYCGIVVW